MENELPLLCSFIKPYPTYYSSPYTRKILPCQQSTLSLIKTNILIHNKHFEAWGTKCLIMLGMHSATKLKQWRAAGHTLRHETASNNQLGIHRGV